MGFFEINLISKFFIYS